MRFGAGQRAEAATGHFSSSALCPNTWAVEEVTLEAGDWVWGWGNTKMERGLPQTQRMFLEPGKGSESGVLENQKPLPQ